MSDTKYSVAEIITERLHALTGQKTAKEIAEEAGLRSTDMLKAYCQRTLRVPLSRAHPIARALGLDPHWFMRLCVEELMGPEVTKEIAESFGEALTEHERIWLEVLRHSTGGNVPPVNAEGAALIWRALEPRLGKVQ